MGRLYFDLFDRLDRNPIPLSDGTLLNGPSFRFVTFSLLYSDFDFPNLASLWQLLNEFLPAATIETTARSLMSVNQLTADVPFDNLTAARLAILCGDEEWPRSAAQYERDLRRDSRLFPMFGPLGSNIWPCAFWPNRPIEPPVRLVPTGPGNILILQNLRDPATSYWGALGLRHALAQRSRIVTVDQGGHGVYFTPNTCAFETATAFLAIGILPKDDPFCAAEASAAGVTHQENAARASAMRALRDRMRP